MATALLDVIDALLAHLPKIAGCAVHDGYPTSLDPVAYVAIGVDDPGSTSRADSADATQEWAHASRRAADESGSVRVAIYDFDGGGVLSAARQRAGRVMDAIDDWLRSQSPPFGLPSIWSVHIADVRLYQDQTKDVGAEVLIVLTIAYQARI